MMSGFFDSACPLRTPDDEVGAGVTGASACYFKLLIHLVEVEAVFVDENAEVFLPNGFFRRFDEPFFADVAPYLPFSRRTVSRSVVPGQLADDVVHMGMTIDCANSLFTLIPYLFFTIGR